MRWIVREKKNNVSKTQIQYVQNSVQLMYVCHYISLFFYHFAHTLRRNHSAIRIKLVLPLNLDICRNK